MEDVASGIISEFWGAAAVAAGATGVVAASVCYALSPPQAALPTLEDQLAQAFHAAATAAIWMKAAGTIGIFSDVLLAAGALTLLGRPGVDALERFGWAAFAVSAVIFITVDALAGFVLGQTALMPGGQVTFAAFKRLFDSFFGLGTLSFGAAAVAIFSSRWRSGAVALGLIGSALGMLAALASTAYFFGLNAAQPIGLSIAAGSIFFAGFGIAEARAVLASPPSKR